MNEKLVAEVRELSDFFTGTYMEKMLMDAIALRNVDLLNMVIKEAKSQRQLIEDAEAQSL